MFVSRHRFSDRSFDLLFIAFGDTILNAFWLPFKRLRCLWASFFNPMTPFNRGKFNYSVVLSPKKNHKWLPKSIQNLKTNKKCALQLNWYVLDVVLTQFWMHFGRHLGGFRSLLVAICCRCWQFWVATWASFGHHRFARCQLWSDTLNFPSCD